jgi:hypothetical protein
MKLKVDTMEVNTLFLKQLKLQLQFFPSLKLQTGCHKIHQTASRYPANVLKK